MNSTEIVLRCYNCGTISYGLPPCLSVSETLANCETAMAYLEDA